MLHRPITAGDVAAVHALYMDPENNRFLDYERISVESFAPLFQEFLRAADTFLVEEGASVVATYRLRRHELRCSHVATLAAFAVAPQFHGQGYAAPIIETVVEKARSQGVRRIELLAEADNPRALRFYEKHGFVREGVFRAAFRRRDEASDVDEIAMGRLL